MSEIKFYNRAAVPVEMHKVKIVQKLSLLPARERLNKLKEAGFNTFMLHNGDIFMDMLTDSGVNAMSDNMQSAMLRADDAYAGSETFYRMNEKLTEIFGMKYLLPTHQGRAGSLVAALYLCGGIRGMERGTLSEERNADGTEHIASVEMVV